MRIAYDIDDTLWKIDRKYHNQVPDYDLIQVLRWFVNNGDEVFVWSAGGIEYANTIVMKLGLTDMVKVIPKGKFGNKQLDIDITFDDDSHEQIGKVNVIINRENPECEMGAGGKHLIKKELINVDKCLACGKIIKTNENNIE